MDKYTELYEAILRDRDPLCLQDLAISGQDLIAMGIPRGKEIGEILEKLMDLVLHDPQKNNKAWLTEYIRENYAVG